MPNVELTRAARNLRCGGLIRANAPRQLRLRKSGGSPRLERLVDKRELHGDRVVGLLHVRT